jgi:uncharacterized protein YebE (UPF0316 family)
MEASSAELFFQLPPLAVTVLIFVARILDVSIGTIRIIVVARGERLIASMLGFVEVLIWLITIGQIMQNLGSIENFLAYAAGFAAGTFVGMSLDQRMAIGSVMVRVVIPRDKATDLIERLKELNYRVTHMDADGAKTPVKVIFTVVPRAGLRRMIKDLRAFDPNAFYTIEDVRQARHPIEETMTPATRRNLLQPFYFFRKGK